MMMCISHASQTKILETESRFGVSTETASWFGTARPIDPTDVPNHLAKFMPDAAGAATGKRRISKTEKHFGPSF
jgi:hypothetical protein